MTDKNVCPTNTPLTPAAILAARARQAGFIVWIDPDRQIYPPALAALGIPLDCVLWIHPAKPRDLVWAIAECLRCPGVDVTIATPPPLSRIEARRLQLAAETGGGIGLLLRPHNPAAPYAAATRWLVTPIPRATTGEGQSRGKAGPAMERPTAPRPRRAHRPIHHPGARP
ncbi:MAG: ImuA family protein [Tepidisphaerales bacterium]